MNATAPVSAQYRYNAENAEALAIAKLPTRAQAKLEHLRKIEGRARALRSGLFDEINTARDNLHAAQRNLAKFDRDNPPMPQIVDGKRVNVAPLGRDELVNWVERCRAEMKRLVDEQNAANNIGFAVADIVDWLIAHASVKIVASPVKLPKIDNLGAALERNRDQQSTLNAELAALENAPRTKAEAKAAMRAAVAALAKQPDVSGLFHGQPLAWPTELLIANGAGAHQYAVAATVRDAFALQVWLNRDALIAKLDAEIERMGDNGAALSREDQAARIATTQAKLLQAQRVEELIIEALEAAGQQITRRCRIPEVLLGVERA